MLRKQRLSDIQREQIVEDTLALSWLRGVSRPRETLHG
jgi:hypothetical protein